MDNGDIDSLWIWYNKKQNREDILRVSEILQKAKIEELELLLVKSLKGVFEFPKVA